MAERVDALGLAVTREPSTVALYEERVTMLKRRASAEIGYAASLFDTVDHFVRLHEEYKHASIRQYAAALKLAVDEDEAAGRLDPTKALACRDLLKTGPVPRPTGAPKRTSANKRKSVPALEVQAVCQALRARGRAEDRLLMRLLINNVTFGLRPCEYHGAVLTEVYLVVRSAKATNGRALCETRELEVDTLDTGQLASLQTLIADMEAAAQGNIPALIDRLGARLRRVCKRLKITQFSLYTTRHQAIANKKAAGSSEEVAAYAGHASVHTARKHYAPRGAAWKVDRTAKPSPHLVEMVTARQAARRTPTRKV